jgi:hypothetical protein
MGAFCERCLAMTRGRLSASSALFLAVVVSGSSSEESTLRTDGREDVD